jgi:hypothetical protein
MSYMADRIAQVLLEDNRDLVTFAVQLVDTDQARRIADSLERLGCLVKIKADGITLTVTCPR